MVDLGEMTRLSLSQAKVMISICLDRFPTAHLSQIVHVLVDPDQGHRPVDLFQDSVKHVSRVSSGELTSPPVCYLQPAVALQTHLPSASEEAHLEVHHGNSRGKIPVN